MRRNQLFEGKYPMPEIIGLREKDAKAYKALMNMFKACWNAYIRDGEKGSTSTLYFQKQSNNANVFNIGLKVLSLGGWITVSTQSRKNWSDVRLNPDKLLTFITAEEIISIRKANKWNKYTLKLEDSDFNTATKVKVNGVIKETGLNRPGFDKTGKTIFSFDTDMMLEYKPEVVRLVNFGIAKTLKKHPTMAKDLANYANIGEEIVEGYIYDNTNRYSGGKRVSDPRGRNSAGYLNKIGNPVGFKIMRSLLVIPEESRNIATEKGLKAKYMAIAELSGFKEGTITSKVALGKKNYSNRVLPTLDLSSDAELKELPELIWLERLYTDLDNYFRIPNYKWKVPIEKDMGASVLGFYGLLLGHKPFLKRCNMLVENDVLSNSWKHPIITNRLQFKTSMRKLYGSTTTATRMWTEMGIAFTEEEAIAFEHEIEEGELAPANRFKNFLISNVEPTPIMNVKIWGETFTVECNKYRNVGDHTVLYDTYDTASKSIKRVQHTDTLRVPDLHAFKRYFPTLLIHHLDSRAMDTTCSTVYDAYGWCLDIHDAIIIDAEADELATTTFAGLLTDMYNDRETILLDFMKSISIPDSTIIKQWDTLIKPHIIPVGAQFTCSLMVLK